MRFTKESLTQLAVGAMVEFGPLFPGLGDDPVVGVITDIKVKPNGDRGVVFAMHYLDTFMGSKTVWSHNLPSEAVAEGVPA